MPGRPRKPTPLHLIDGHSSKAAARAAAGEPPSEAVTLEPPAHLDAAETAAWKYYAGLAGAMRVTTKDDAGAMEVLAVSWAAKMELDEIIRKLRKDGGDADGDNAYTYETVTKDGSTMRRIRPEWTIVQELDRKIMLILGRFGLTPSDRSKVRKVESGGGVDPDSEFT